MRLSMALSAALAAVVLGAALLLGPGATALAAVGVIAVIAWGWPRQMGAPARLSLSIVLLCAGVLSSVLMLLWPTPGEGPRTALRLLDPLAVVLAWGVIAAFVVQLVRGTGRPLRLESTVATMGGVLACGMTACWIPLARYAETPRAEGLGATLVISLVAVSLLGLTPWMQGRPRVLALAMVPACALAAWLVSSLLGADPAAQTLHALAAAAVAGLVSLTAAAAPSSRPRPEDQPVGTTLRPRRAGYALAMAPVGAAGVIGHVLLALLG
ncbi:hypothetical protein [Micrococcus sp.]|uniref:hypothetical protein n=1 Tax=Micrococcus sp. TaxID=1271 RepID=UPI002A919326|nr:hypothetical protein [Micrococcus sp.]MDY6055620.1 hypothetical protein [Micrococcus sp.]